MKDVCKECSCINPRPGQHFGGVRAGILNVLEIAQVNDHMKSNFGIVELHVLLNALETEIFEHKGTSRNLEEEYKLQVKIEKMIEEYTEAVRVKEK